MKEYLPYIVSIFVAGITAFISYFTARSKTKTDIKILQENNQHEITRLMEQHKVDIDSFERKHKMEIEKMELELQHELTLKEKETENQLGTDIVSTMLKEFLKSPAGQAQMRQAGNIKHK